MRAAVHACMAAETPLIHERSARFRRGSPPLFYRESSRLIRDLGVLALAVMASDDTQRELRVLDAMSGTGVRALRYSSESGGTVHVHANELMEGNHPLHDNLADAVANGRCTVTAEDATALYHKARLSGSRYDLVDCDAFGTGQPHIAEAWWAVSTRGLLYLCATDSCTMAGHNPHKAVSGYAAVANALPAVNEQGLRLVVGASFREAAARNLHAEPLFAFFHAPSSSFRIMMRLRRLKAPPAAAYANLAHLGRCTGCGQLWKVPSMQLGQLASLRPCLCGRCGEPAAKAVAEAEAAAAGAVAAEAAAGVAEARATAGGAAAAQAAAAMAGVEVETEQAAGGVVVEADGGVEAAALMERLSTQELTVHGPMWVGPMHDLAFVSRMREEA